MHERYEQAERMLPWNVAEHLFQGLVNPHWLPNHQGLPTDICWYRKRIRQGFEFVLVDCAAAECKPAFNHQRLAIALSELRGTSYTPENLPFSSIEFDASHRRFGFVIDASHYTVDLDTYQCNPVPCPHTASEQEELRSPDDRWALELRDNNLFLRSVESGETVALTTDGGPHNGYGVSSSINELAFRLAGAPRTINALWSPDSRRVLVQQIDQRGVCEQTILQHAPRDGSARPVTHIYRYPLPGDPDVGTVQYLIFDVEQRSAIAADHPPQSLTFSTPLEMGHAWWDDSGETIYFLDTERGCRSIRLCELNARSGATRVIITEQSSTYLEMNVNDTVSDPPSRPNVRVLAQSREIIWYSERDGWGHLYLYAGESDALVRQLTSGPWVVHTIVHVDEERRLLYFTAGGREPGRDPYYRHLYWIHLDTLQIELLTPEHADHDVRLSPSQRFFLDTYSRVDTAPITVLRSVAGELVLKIEEADLSDLFAQGWRWPEPFASKANDGVTDIYGVLYYPSHFDPSRQYPVIDSVYGAPQMRRTPKSFQQHPSSLYFFWQFWEPQSLAELGFIVVTIDGRGTPERSKTFHDKSFGNLGDPGTVDDHISALRELAAARPYLDLSRVGVYGFSGGGYAAAHYLLLAPDFYRVGVALAGNHDQRGFDARWAEKYLGTTGAEGYANQATGRLADRLVGHLLLASGDMDYRVHPCLTLQLVDALIKANKDFDLLLLPNQTHLSSLVFPYFIRRQWDYFVQHLLAEQPPKHYQIRAPENPAFQVKDIL